MRFVDGRSARPPHQARHEDGRGEHGGDPSSIHFFEKVGLNYVSCSPFRVPVARLHGRAAIENETTHERRFDHV